MNVRSLRVRCIDGFWLLIVLQGREFHMYDVQIKDVMQAAHLLLIPLNESRDGT